MRAPDSDVLQEDKPPADETSKRFFRDPLLWGIVVAALLVRVLYNLALHPGGHVAAGFVIDEREYFGAAHILAEGRGFSFFDSALWVRPPLYVMLLVALIGAAGSSTFPVLLVQSILSAATLLPLAWLANQVGGIRAGRMAALLGLLYLPFTLFAGLLLSETLFLFLFSIALVALLHASRTLRVVDSGSLRQGAAGPLGAPHPAVRSRIRYSWLAAPLAAGVLMGLATLTRATSLAFVPLAVVWLLFMARRARGRRKYLPAAALLAASVLTLVPWTLRNYVAYHRFVVVDTTSGYNLWLGSVGVRDEERLQGDLRGLAGPVERQDFAYARAWENISADPAGFLGKGIKESLDLWKPLFSAEERQVKNYTLGRVPDWHMLALLLFDDLLYAAVLVFAAAGLLLAPPHPLKWLTLLWVFLWVALSFVFFAVTRFRLPVVAALVPWAGVGLALLRPSARPIVKFRGKPVTHRLLFAFALLGVAVLVLPDIDVPNTLLGAHRWEEQAPFRNGEALVREGQIDAAIGQYKLANTSIPDTRYALAAAYLRKGSSQAAMAQLKSDEPPDRFEPFIIKGEAARASGDLGAARSLFSARAVQVAGEDALDWAWDHTDPPPTAAITLGNGLDIGYIRGFHGQESENGVSFRWTSESAQVRRLRPEYPDNLQVSWSGWRPDGTQRAHTSIVATQALPLDGSGPLHELTLLNSRDWEVYDLPPRSTLPEGITFGLDLRVNGFVPSGSDPRLLGVRVSHVGAPP